MADKPHFLLIVGFRWYLRQQLQKKPVEGFSAGLFDDEDLYKWEIMVVGPPGTYYEEGYFKASMVFPKEYPQRPPTLTFISDIWHPNGVMEPFTPPWNSVHTWGVTLGVMEPFTPPLYPLICGHTKETKTKCMKNNQNSM
ncbi:predicted protein [Nematostella vectensis]|uniref:UBC core domain-containing protein n=1 Tax=Nematostella vectensis TaxID=45351 RepID=A7SJX4_NEMVE|nr:predicted protein [Nematostella vectensis]|eukprot:XP_001628018.1 predicted protein [Nematostella vectensis]